MKIDLIKPLTRYILIIALGLAGCKKQNEWLDQKNRSDLVVPKTLNDLGALLNNTFAFNTNQATGGSGLIGTDNIFITDVNIDAITVVSERNAYLFKKDLYEGGYSFGYFSYYPIGLTNIVLDQLNTIPVTNANRDQYNNIKGQALFFRSYGYYNLAQLFCKPYSAATAATDLGLQLRLSSDVLMVVKRSTVKETYERIISDLDLALGLCPDKQLYTTLPSKNTITALLAKVYLNMEDYPKAGEYAGKVLSGYNKLLDFNTLLNTTDYYRFPTYYNDPTKANPEILFFATGGYSSAVGPYGVGYVDTSLYNSYDHNDLRKTLFYMDAGAGDHKVLGMYSGDYSNFYGIATNELILLRAECEARQGNAAAAMEDLNLLLSKRYLAGTFVPLSASDADAALVLVLGERRKELPFTSQIRWEDLRRLNKDPRFARTITHLYKGTSYTLPPNDPRYVFPIPDAEIRLSGIEQNPR